MNVVLPALLVLVLAGSASAAPLQPARAQAAVHEAARRALPAAVVEVEVLSLSVRSQIDVPEGATLRARAGVDERWLGSVAVEVDVFDGGAHIGTVPVVAMIVGWADVPVLQQPVARGQVVDAKAVGLVRREVDRLQAGYVLDVSRLKGRVARRDLALGQAIKDADLEAAVDAPRNQPVVIVVNRGALTLHSPGVLREDARIGDLVSVWNEGTRQEQRGILKSPGVVELPTLGPLASGLAP